MGTHDDDDRYDPDRVRANIRRTVWICVAIVVVLLGLFFAEHLM